MHIKHLSEYVRIAKSLIQLEIPRSHHKSVMIEPVANIVELGRVLLQKIHIIAESLKFVEKIETNLENVPFAIWNSNQKKTLIFEKIANILHALYVEINF